MAVYIDTDINAIGTSATSAATANTATVTTNVVGVSATNFKIVIFGDNYPELVETSFTMAESFRIDQRTLITTPFTMDSSISLGTSSYLESLFTMNDSTRIIWTPTPVIDSFTINDVITFENTAGLADSFTIKDTLLPINQTTSLVSYMRLTDEITYAQTASLISTLTISDSRILATIASLVSNLTISGEIQSTNRATSFDLTSGMTLNDSLKLGLQESLADTALFLDSVETFNIQLGILTSSFTITNVQLITATTKENLASVMQLSDSQSFEGSIYNVLLLSTIEIGDIIWSPDFGAIAWTMNTQGLSIAPFDNFGFNSIVAHNGHIFATSPEGIFEITGDKDNGRDISAHVQWGFQDFGIKERKRASDLYIGYTGGDLEAQLETYDGPEIVYNYSIEQRIADAPRNNRFKVGRGLASRYWRLNLHNLAGAGFQIQDIALNVYSSKRRL